MSLQGIGPQFFELNTLQSGAPNTNKFNNGNIGNYGSVSSAGIAEINNAPIISAPTQTTAQPAQSSSLELQEQLNQLKALNSAQAPQGSGIGQVAGSAIGSGAGMAIGEAVAPGMGSVVGASAGAMGGALGSIVDYMLDSDAKGEAERLRIDEMERQKRIALKKRASEEWLENMARSKGIQMGEEQQIRDKNTVAQERRGRLMEDMLARLAKGTQFSDAMKQKYLKTRSL